MKLIASKPYTSSQKFSILLEFLQDWRNRLEYMGASIREDTDKHGSADRSDPKTGRTHDGTSGEGSSQDDNQHRKRLSRCWLHNLDGEAGDHPIWKCKVFLGKGTQERRDLVVANKACMRCLLPTCVGASDVSMCVRSFTCSVSGCHRTHNRLLHVDGAAYHANESSDSSASNAILPTQKVGLADHFGTKRIASALWDGGSTLTFITFDKAKSLQLHGKDVKLALVSIGGKSTEIDSKMYKLKLINQEGQMVEIDAYGIQKISSQVERVSYETIAEILGVKPCDVSRPIRGEIEILIGQQAASLHPVRVKAVGNLILMKNEFRLVVSGSHPKIKTMEAITPSCL